MRIIGRHGTHEQHVASAICGIRAKEVVLDAKDFHWLANSTPEELKHWAINLSSRFPPQELYKAISKEKSDIYVAGPGGNGEIE